MARFDRGGCHLYTGDASQPPQLLASAATIAQAAAHAQ